MALTPSAEQRRIIAHDTSRNARILLGLARARARRSSRCSLQISRSTGRRGKLLTFTRAATNELAGKVSPHSEGLDRPSTVHSFSISTLLANTAISRLPQPIRIADNWEWDEIIRRHLSALLGCTVRDIDRAKAEMASNWESLVKSEEPRLSDEIRSRFTGTWQHDREVFGYSLLEELPYRLLEVLEDHADLDLGDWQVIVVDEYQDLNQCDISVLKQIASRGRCLVAVGDDDQSIYSFRHAHPAGIRDFVGTDFPGAVDYHLSTSQRCGTSILDWARHVIEGLPGRPPRPRLTPSPDSEAGEARYLHFDHSDREAEGVARLVQWLIQTRNIEPEEIAVLFRSNPNNAWSQWLTDPLAARGVPVVNPGVVDEMLAESSNRRLLATARLLANPTDSLAWWTLLGLTRGIGPAVRDHIYNRATSHMNTFGEQVLVEYENQYPDLRPQLRGKVIAAIRSTLEAADKFDLRSADLGDGGWGIWLSQNSLALGGCEPRFCELLTDIDAAIDPDEDLGRFLGQIQPVGRDLRSGHQAKAVRLMKMRSSKGLTVRAAIVVGVEDGVIPLLNKRADEERRLLYVAMTRSKEFLYLTWSGRRTGRTAHSGIARIGERRNRSRLLAGGPVPSESGERFLVQRGA